MIKERNLLRALKLSSFFPLSFCFFTFLHMDLCVSSFYSTICLSSLFNVCLTISLSYCLLCLTKYLMGICFHRCNINEVMTFISLKKKEKIYLQLPWVQAAALTAAKEPAWFLWRCDWMGTWKKTRINLKRIKQITQVSHSKNVITA